MKLNTKDFEERMGKAITALENNFDTIRAGQANAAVLNRVSFEYYGSPTPISTMADIRVADARTLTITPYDATTLKAIEKAILATVSACESMSKERVGVLLVFERDVPLEEYFKTGTRIDAQTTEQLLKNLFFPKASLHDGAVIIREGRVAAAGCVMPLSENTHLSSDLGTRHRAGVGTSEVSDAVVVIVSEETGTISVAIGGMLKRHLAPQMLQRLLISELVPNEETQNSWLVRIKQTLNKRKQNNAK